MEVGKKSNKIKKGTECTDTESYSSLSFPQLMHREITKGTGSLERSLDTISNNLHSIDQVCNFGRIPESVIEASSLLSCSLYQGNSGYTAASLVTGQVKTNAWDYDILSAGSASLHSASHQYGNGYAAASLVTGQVKANPWESNVLSIVYDRNITEFSALSTESKNSYKIRSDQRVWAGMLERLGKENSISKLLTYENSMSVTESHNGNTYTLTLHLHIHITGDCNIVGEKNNLVVIKS